MDSVGWRELQGRYSHNKELKLKDLPLSDKFKSQMELASDTRSWMTWAPADPSFGNEDNRNVLF